MKDAELVKAYEVCNGDTINCHKCKFREYAMFCMTEMQRQMYEALKKHVDEERAKDPNEKIEEERNRQIYALLDEGNSMQRTADILGIKKCRVQKAMNARRKVV